MHRKSDFTLWQNPQKMCAIVIKFEAVCLRCEFDSCFLVCVFAHFSSEEWNKVSKSEREKLGVTVQDDGEFW